MDDNREIEEILRRAQEVVEAADLAAEFRAIAYEKAVELLAPGASTGAPAAPSAPPAAPSEPPVAEPARSESERPRPTGSLERIAEGLGIDMALVEETYEVADGELRVIIPRSRLSQRGARPAMRQLILLAAAGRQAGGWDSRSTPVAELRAVCEHYGGRYYDENNFTNSLNGLSNYLSRTTRHRSRDAAVRLLPAGYSRAGEQIAELLGDSP